MPSNFIPRNPVEAVLTLLQSVSWVSIIPASKMRLTTTVPPWVRLVKAGDLVLGMGEASQHCSDGSMRSLFREESRLHDSAPFGKGRGPSWLSLRILN